MITTIVETITPQLAQDYLGCNKRNRTLNKNHVINLTRQIEQGLWIFDGNPIRFSENGNLLDGQHRLEACVKANIPIQTLVVRGLPEESFQNIDTGKGRSGGDILSIDGCPNAQCVSGSIHRYFNLCDDRQIVYGNASTSNVSNIRGNISKPKIFRFYQENRALCEEIGRHATSMGTGRFGVKIYPSTFIGAYELYLIKEKNHRKPVVFGFFEQLTTGENIANKSVLTLRNVMLRFNTKTLPLTAKQRIAYFTKAWNAYITGKEITALQYHPGVDDTLELM